MRLLAVALLVALSLPAVAADEDFQRFYNAALRLHEGLEYERALEQLALARRQATTGDQMSLVNLAEGVVLADLNRQGDAMVAFKEGLLLAPDAKLPLRVSPKVSAEVEALRERVKKELAPLLAKQEADRKRAEAEAKALEQARLEAEQKKAEAEASAREAQRLDDEKRKAEADAKAKEAARLLAEADAKLKEIARLEEERKRSLLVSDKPQKVLILPNPPEEAPPPLVVTRAPPSKAPMVMTVVFLVAGAAAAGVGGFFGSQSQLQVQAARDAAYQDDAKRALDQASERALAANVLFGAAGGMGLGALISGIVWGSSSAPEPLPPSAPAAEGAR
jgi:hypothetical protein